MTPPAEGATPPADKGAAQPATPPPDKSAAAPKDSAGQPPVDATKALEKPAVPEKYELKLPQGSLLQSGQMEEIAAYAKAQGFSNEQAQALVEREHKAIASYVESQTGVVARNARVDAWVKEAMADKEIGGSEENLKASAEHARRAATQFFDKSVLEFLETTGYGSHPGIIRGFAKIGKLMANDKLVQPGSHTTGAKKSAAQVLYGDTSNQQ